MMKKSTLIILAILFAIVSCAPIVKTPGVLPFWYIKWDFDKESEQILVLPIWRKYPFILSEGGPEPDVVYVFDEPLFLTVKELSDLHQMIPSKTSAVLMGISTAMGRMINLESVVIISETGKMVTIHCSDWRNGMLLCKQYYYGNVNPQLKNDLVLTLTNSTGVVRYPPLSIGRSMGRFHSPCKIQYSKKEKQSILDFLNGVKIKIEQKNPLDELKDASIEKKRILLDDPNYRSRNLNESCKFHSDCVGDLMCIKNVCTNR